MSLLGRVPGKRLLTAVAVLASAMALPALAQDSGLLLAQPTTGTPATDSTMPWPPPGGSPYSAVSNPGLAEPADSLPTAPAVGPVELANLIAAENPKHSHWYARWDYYTWNERLDGQEFVQETGSLTTIGYQRRLGVERFRAELFGGTVDYRGFAMFPNGYMEPLASYTSYLGARAEVDFLWEPAAFPNLGFFAGAGTRVWVRDLKDGLTASGHDVWGYQEVWWTIYPYVGMEVKQPLNQTLHFFGAMRAGLTPITYEQISAMDVALYPKCGATGQLECGVRGAHFTLSAYLEMMEWNQSSESRGILQPYSRFLIAGIKGGWAF
jgi:hypothetical protein